MTDRGRDTSMALIEVRTVLSRAETALKALDGSEDPDAELMRQALYQCIAALRRWRRTGRPQRSPAPKRKKCPACNRRIRIAEEDDWRGKAGELVWHYDYDRRRECQGTPEGEK